MTPDQWRDLTADLQLSTWGYSHWIKALRTHIWRKFEDRRYLNLKGSIVRVVREIHAPAETEYPERVLFEGKMAGDFEEKWQAYCDVHDVNIAIYTDSSGKNKRYIMPSWTKEWKPAGAAHAADRRPVPVSAARAFGAVGGYRHDENRPPMHAVRTHSFRRRP